MLTVELNEKLQSVELFLDSQGMDELITALQSMRGKVDHHAHFMTPSWGGKELGETPHSSNKLVNHLIVYSLG
jgi:hypothetical protein